MSTGREYRILEVLGRGGFGTVYRAEVRDEGDFRAEVALKMLNADVDNTDEFVQRFRDEARVLGLLRHRGIVRVERLVRFGPRWTIVMEFLTGADLKAVLASDEVPLRVALEIIGHVADALYVASTAHDQGSPLNLVHRDLKPANVFVSPLGEVKLLDFGIARMELDSREAQTRSNFLATPEYLAPERLRGEEGAHGDVFSLGAVLYECVSGDKLFRPPKNAPFAPVLMDPSAYSEYLDSALGSLPPHVPGSVRRLLRLMLSWEPAIRPPARQVEYVCRHLASEQDGPWLRDWAEAAVPAAMSERERLPDDALSGATLREGIVYGGAEEARVSDAPQLGASSSAHGATISDSLFSAQPHPSAQPAYARPQVMAESGTAGDPPPQRGPAPTPPPLLPPPPTIAHQDPPTPRATRRWSTALLPVPVVLLVLAMAGVAALRLPARPPAQDTAAAPSAVTSALSEDTEEPTGAIDSGLLVPAPEDPPTGSEAPTAEHPSSHEPAASPRARPTKRAPAAAEPSRPPAPALSELPPEPVPSSGPVAAATVSVTGTFESAQLVGTSKTFAPGTVEPGSYELMVNFGGSKGVVHAATFEVNPGDAVRFRCDRGFASCQRR
ncbi:MAG: protein kinase [Alphaproteobacteria bacterium]|nr:protein kinase [Alphaproteobacteria bacterium]